MKPLDAFFAGCMLTIAFTFITTCFFSQWYWQCQAVKHRAAYWEVNDTGCSTFQWIHKSEMPDASPAPD